VSEHTNKVVALEDMKYLERNSFWISIVATLLATFGFVASLVTRSGNAWTIAPMILAGLLGIRLTRTGRFTLANSIIITISIFNSTAEVLTSSGASISRAAIIVFGVGTIAMIAMPRRLIGRTLILTLLAAIGLIMLDLFGPAGRSIVEQTPTRIGITLIILLAFLVLAAREFPSFDLRTKITLGILGTGGVALGVLAFFAVSRASQLVSTISSRFETTVNLLAEEQLINTVTTEANKANNTFSLTVTQVSSLVNELEALQKERDSLGTGTYWNATDELFILSNGQYTNNLGTPSSVFIPSFLELSDYLIQELNTTVYLDFSAPFILESNPQIKAVYYTNTEGLIVYYPNVRLGANVAHDYDGRNQTTYRVSTPLFNPQRIAKWSYPRRDPNAVGLIVSVSIPVYFDDEFEGVMTADFQLNRVARDINAIHVGQTGYAFLINSDGHIISMPPQGYDLFNLIPETLENNAEPTQTIFDGDVPFEIQQITKRMVVGGSGLVTTQVDGEDVFVSYAPVADNNFSLGLIVPVKELTQPLIATQIEIANQSLAAIRSAAIILVILLIIAIFASLLLGQIISAPILRLTQTANQILEGDLTAQATILSKDETGTLAQAFNAMTSRLRATFEGLEKNIEERTAELFNANERNERRAKQFQSIAQVARTISSTLEFDSLLRQITTVISREFGFYHVGVFLLDSAREYAVLSATNSEGGQKMLARNHRLKVGERGLVGFVSSTGRPRVALDTGADAVFFNNPDLPETHSEIALPLRAGEKVIGVLDVQSTEPSAFSQEDINILSTLADQVSIAIQNAKQNQETKKALAEADALSKQFVQTGWAQFTRRQKLVGVYHTGAKGTVLYTDKGSNNEKQIKNKGRGASLSIPIRLRDEVIGSVDVSAIDHRKWTQDELDIVAAIIERAAIAMENARLLTESQRRASKERTIGEISARISAQSEIDQLLRTAVQELNKSIPGTEVAIQFRKEETE